MRYNYFTSVMGHTDREELIERIYYSIGLFYVIHVARKLLDKSHDNHKLWKHSISIIVMMTLVITHTHSPSAFVLELDSSQTGCLTPWGVVVRWTFHSLRLYHWLGTPAWRCSGGRQLKEEVYGGPIISHSSYNSPIHKHRATYTHLRIYQLSGLHETQCLLQRP